MSELVITSKEDLEKMLINILSQIPLSHSQMEDTGQEDRMNQKEAAQYLGITQATLIRWKKKGRVPCQQLPGSTKVTYYKSQLRAVLQRNPELLQPSRK